MLCSLRFARLVACGAALAVALAPQTASALWIHIEWKSWKVGSWSLLGVSFDHTRSQLCVTAGPGDLPAEYQNFGITFDDGKGGVTDVCLTDLQLFAGPDALAALGGDPLIFDDTMFPAPPGFAFDTLGGTEFNIHFDTPRPTADGPPQIFLPGVFVSSRLPLGDPNLIQAEARLIGGHTFPVLVTAVPEPGSSALLASAAAILGGNFVYRRRRRWARAWVR